MAECGICLDVLRAPVCLPCGHIHCERCLRAHISAGTDALRSACPTCRKSFHTATPDFAFVPQKYHEFILPTVRKVYMDIPSVTAMSKDIDVLTQRLEALGKEADLMRQRCTRYKERLADLESEKLVISEQEAEARQETLDLREKYDSLKKRYREARDNAWGASASQSLSRCNSRDFGACREVHPKVEEYPVSLQDLDPHPPRPKRALPKSRLSNGAHGSDQTGKLQVVKRQRTHRHSDVGSSSHVLTAVVKGEDDDE